MNPCEKKVISEQKIEVKPESKKKKNNQAAVRVGDSQITLPWIMKMRRWPGFLLVFSAVQHAYCRGIIAAALFFNNDCSIWGFVSLLCASLRLLYALVRSETALCSLQVKYLLHLLRIFQLQSSMFSTYFLIAFLLPYHGLSLEHYFHNITIWACHLPTCQ